jgi:hypothetical protein
MHNVRTWPRWFSPALVCLDAKRDLELSRNDIASIGGIIGGKPQRLARVTTPFILERANPS